MSWLGAALLVLLFAWTLMPNGLGAIAWDVGHYFGARASKRAFSNPSGKTDDLAE